MLKILHTQSFAERSQPKTASEMQAHTFKNNTILMIFYCLFIALHCSNLSNSRASPRRVLRRVIAENFVSTPIPRSFDSEEVQFLAVLILHLLETRAMPAGRARPPNCRGTSIT